jgi:multiple sugar transport system ATP-binding protein
VSFQGVGKVYPDGTRALHGFDLDIADGEFMVFVGPSGCGKTTALRMLAGLERVTEGVIRIDGRVVNDLEPRSRDVAMVFQNYALYPQKSVYDNIAFGLRMRKVPRGEIRDKVEATAAALGLTDLLERRPAQLSGGQRQRVAMGRAIVREPALFLMDEPLSNLDAQLRVDMRAEIARLQQDLRITTVYVTHDQVEALTLGDRVCVMSKGQMQQVGTPRDVYDRPLNTFVARFLGSPSMNLMRARIARSNGGLSAAVGGQVLELPASPRTLQGYVGREVLIGLRPECVGQGDACIHGTVKLAESLGSESLVHLDVPDLVTSDGRPAALIGRLPPSVMPSLGQRIELPLELHQAHFFDPDSGSALV